MLRIRLVHPCVAALLIACTILLFSVGLPRKIRNPENRPAGNRLRQRDAYIEALNQTSGNTTRDHRGQHEVDSGGDRRLLADLPTIMITI